MAGSWRFLPAGTNQRKKAKGRKQARHVLWQLKKKRKKNLTQERSPRWIPTEFSSAFRDFNAAPRHNVSNSLVPLTLLLPSTVAYMHYVKLGKKNYGSRKRSSLPSRIRCSWEDRRKDGATKQIEKEEKKEKEKTRKKWKRQRGEGGEERERKTEKETSCGRKGEKRDPSSNTKTVGSPFVFTTG